MRNKPETNNGMFHIVPRIFPHQLEYLTPPKQVPYPVRWGELGIQTTPYMIQLHYSDATRREVAFADVQVLAQTYGFTSFSFMYERYG